MASDQDEWVVAPYGLGNRSVPSSRFRRSSAWPMQHSGFASAIFCKGQASLTKHLSRREPPDDPALAKGLLADHKSRPPRGKPLT